MQNDVNRVENRIAVGNQGGHCLNQQRYGNSAHVQKACPMLYATDQQERGKNIHVIRQR